MSDAACTYRLDQNNAYQKCKQSYFGGENTLIDMNDLCTCVSKAADRVYAKLVTGLAKSVYQQELFKCLSEEGLHLEVETSMLTQCAKNEPCRRIIIVNGVLVIECITENEIITQHQKRLIFDLQINDHVMGLLINFGENTKLCDISKVYQNTLHH